MKKDFVQSSNDTHLLKSSVVINSQSTIGDLAPQNSFISKLFNPYSNQSSFFEGVDDRSNCNQMTIFEDDVENRSEWH